jgi:hypothetical protein
MWTGHRPVATTVVKRARIEITQTADNQPFVGFFMGTSSFLILTSYFLQYERDISQILSLTLNASSIRLRGEREDTL